MSRLGRSLRREKAVAGNQPSFHAPLTHNLLLTKGQGVATFTRATKATVIDFEGLLKTAKSGEARFDGARRVENLLTFTEDFTNATWGKLSGCVANGGKNVTFPASAGARINKSNATSLIGETYVFTVKMAVPTGTTLSMDIQQNVAPFTMIASATIVGDGVERIYSIKGTLTTTITTYVSIRYSSGNSSTIYIKDIRLENVTGQYNQNPGEYVSNGVLSAPYHGANVDGVKYFDTYNGNTVSNNVVTEATGSKIPEAGLHGAMIEVTSTNLFVQSEDPTTTWGDVGSSGKAKNQNISPRGDTTGGRVSTTVGYSQFGLYQTVTYTAVPWTLSIYAKAGTYNYIALDMMNVANVGAVFDLTNGTIGYTDSNVTSRIETLPNGWYRCSITKTMTAATGYPELYLSGSRTANTRTWTGAGTENLDIWGVQLEALPFASSYIPTTTASVTRNADVLTYPNAGNVSDTAGTVLMETTPCFDIPNGSTGGYGFNYLIDFGVASGVIITTVGRLRRQDGTNIVFTPAWTPLKNTTYKIGSRYGSVGQRNWLGGTPGTNGLFDGSIDSGANMTIGGYGASTAYNWGGHLKNIKIYKKALSDAKVTTLTT